MFSLGLCWTFSYRFHGTYLLSSLLVIHFTVYVFSYSVVTLRPVHPRWDTHRHKCLMQVNSAFFPKLQLLLFFLSFRTLSSKTVLGISTYRSFDSHFTRFYSVSHVCWKVSWSLYPLRSIWPCYRVSSLLSVYRGFVVEIFVKNLSFTNSLLVGIMGITNRNFYPVTILLG